jgi:hypothetical protein
MKTSQLNIVPLALANLCLDCEMITAAGASCGFCGSAALMSLARLLSRAGSGVVFDCQEPTVAKMAPNQTLSKETFFIPSDHTSEDLVPASTHGD